MAIARTIVTTKRHAPSSALIAKPGLQRGGFFLSAHCHMCAHGCAAHSPCEAECSFRSKHCRELIERLARERRLTRTGCNQASHARRRLPMFRKLVLASAALATLGVASIASVAPASAGWRRPSPSSSLGAPLHRAPGDHRRRLWLLAQAVYRNAVWRDREARQRLLLSRHAGRRRSPGSQKGPGLLSSELDLFPNSVGSKPARIAAQLPPVGSFTLEAPTTSVAPEAGTLSRLATFSRPQRPDGSHA